MAATRTPDQSIAELHADQQRRWRQGERVPVEAYLGAHPSLRDDAECVLQLVNNEVVLREQLHDAPRLEEYLQRFPHFADQLRELFEVHRALESARVFTGSDGGTPASTLRSGGPTASVPLCGPAPVPGYEILGELGRGGMGVVYKARQVSLNRLVALKMILAGAHADPADLQRFRAEAEAVARLQHPHIVQVIEVGEAGGSPYLVLEYVEGGSLADRLTGKPYPARPAAELVKALARAVHYAHRHGVVHRDLKPANILLQRQQADGRGQEKKQRDSASCIPKIADFGLAKRLEGEAGQTESGAVLGTPSYMAPEQAAGRSAQVGPAADTYALGALLYELLTGRPPFLGESPLDTVLQVRSQDPVPPRRLQPTLPRDLETICLKCLRKEPAKRYASAAALADDLRRFLAGRPVAARPAGVSERTWKWVQGRPAVAGLLAALVLAALGLVLGSAWFTATLRAERDAAQAERDKTDQARHEANDRAEAETRFREQEGGERRRAEASYRLAREELEATVKRVLADPRFRTDSLAARERVALEAQASFLEQFVTLHGDAPAFQVEWGLAHLRLGRVWKELASQEKALNSFTRARAAFQVLAARHPAIPEYQADLAESHENLGLLYRDTGRRREAGQAFQDAHALRQTLAAKRPADARYRTDLARSHANLGLWHLDSERPAEAEQACNACRTLLRDLTARHPAVEEDQARLATTCNDLGLLLIAGRRWDDAREAFQQARDLLDRLVHAHPDAQSFRHALALSYHHLGVLHNQAGRLHAALRCHRRARELREELVAANPVASRFQSELALSWHHLGLVFEKRSRLTEAARAFQEAVHRQSAVVRRAPGQPDHIRSLSSHYAELAAVQRRLGQHAAAALTAGARARLRPRDPDHLYGVAHELALCVLGVGRERPPLDDAERDRLRREYADRALDLLRQAVAQGFTDTDRLKEDGALDPVRSRAAFRELLAAVEGKAKIPGR
jgi:tetratricopeptide (TPR) repeat protein